AAVDGFDGPVGGAVAVEERQDCLAFAVQGAAEFGELFESVGHLAAQLVDDVGHHLIAGGGFGVLVGVDDVLVDEVGDFDGDVLVAFGKDPGQPVGLPFGQQRPAGEHGAPPAVEHVACPAAAPTGVLLDTLPAGGEVVTGQLDNVKRIGYRYRFGQSLFRGSVIHGVIRMSG